MNASSILRGRLVGFTLLALVFLTFLGHIAPLPSSAHAPFVASPTTPEHPDRDAGASHVASCDATVSRPAPSSFYTEDGAPWMLQPVIGPALARPMAVIPARSRPSGTDPGVRLFVLHASFLI